MHQRSSINLMPTLSCVSRGETKYFITERNRTSRSKNSRNKALFNNYLSKCSLLYKLGIWGIFKANWMKEFLFFRFFRKRKTNCFPRLVNTNIKCQGMKNLKPINVSLFNSVLNNCTIFFTSRSIFDIFLPLLSLIWSLFDLFLLYLRSYQDYQKVLRCYRANSEKLHLVRLFGIAREIDFSGKQSERFEWIALYGGTLFYRRHRSPCMHRATLLDLLLSLRVSL